MGPTSSDCDCTSWQSYAQSNDKGSERNLQYVNMKVTQSRPTLCNSMDYTIHGILQARTVKWIAVPFSRGSSSPRNQTQDSHTAGGFFTSWATREAQRGPKWRQSHPTRKRPGRVVSTRLTTRPSTFRAILGQQKLGSNRELPGGQVVRRPQFQRWRVQLSTGNGAGSIHSCALAPRGSMWGSAPGPLTGRKSQLLGGRGEHAELGDEGPYPGKL